MHGTWRAARRGTAILTLALATGCTSSPPAADDPAAVRATAAPGTYGAEVDPSLPEPTDVATDPPAPATTPDSAAVVVTYSGWTEATAQVEVGAYVSGLAESGGTCTLTLTSGSRSARSEVTGEPDAASTSCPAMAVDGDELSAGTWRAVVRYESASTSGESDPVEVVVP
jgi:hypothetical protein